MDLELTSALSALRQPAPQALRARTLVASGAADGFGAVDTSIGMVLVGFSVHGISGLVPIDDESELLRRMRTRRDAVPLRVDDVPDRFANAVRHAVGEGAAQLPHVDLSGVTDFQRRVLEATAQVRRGEITSYGTLARRIGHPAAVRAVGTALARNPVPLLIPCHRVVRSDGRVGQYAFGSAMKTDLLAREGLDTDDLRAALAS